MKKKYIIIALVIIVVALLIAFRFFGNKETGITVSTEKVSRRDITEVIVANGRIQPVKEVKISADVSGEITELYVEEGEFVEKGEKLLKIDPKIYLSQIERIEASLNMSKSQLMQSQAQLLDKENQYKRQKQLKEAKAISEMEFEQAETAYKIAQAAYKSSEYSVYSSQASLKEAKENLAKTTIYAPISGTVSMLNVEQGERVVGTMQMTGTEIMRIADLSKMEVLVEVNENDIIRVDKKDTAFVEVDAYLDRKFKAVVTHIANSANLSQANTGQATNFKVRILLLEESYKDLLNQNKNNSPFRPGMSAGVSIHSTSLKKVLSLPVEAVTVKSKENNKDELDEVVFVCLGDTAYKRIVKTGIQDNQYIQIISGLEEGEEVAVSPYTTITKMLYDQCFIERRNKDDLEYIEDDTKSSMEIEF